MNNSQYLRQPNPQLGELCHKLWIYTNYDCNLYCSYCVARSTPKTPRCAISLETIRQLVDEALDLGFSEFYFTGGEPFLIKDIYDILAYSSQKAKTTVLTNATLIKNRRLDQLTEITNENLTVQVSLDGGRPDSHDAYRGQGTWIKTVEGIKRLLERGFKVRLSTTVTPANLAFQGEICEFHQSIGIPEEAHFIRPLAKRGFSQEGLEVDMTNMLPEVTVNNDGVFWHPLLTDRDMQVSKTIFPLADAVQFIQEQLQAIASGEKPRNAFT
jgi:MoaA/NifB/PqqE/SkfB family radical SAM enzyme